MEIVINELESTLDVVPDAALLDPSILRRITEAVMRDLATNADVASWARRERAADPWGVT